MVTKRAILKHIPAEAINLSLGPDFCAYMVNGEVVTKSYAELFRRKECQHLDYDEYFNACPDCGASDLLPEEEA